MRGFWFRLFYLASFGEWSVAGGSDQSGYGHNAMGEQHRENDVNYVRGFFGFDGLSSPTCRSGNALRASSIMASQFPNVTTSTCSELKVIANWQLIWLQAHSSI
jgi:hypothetical protein